MNCRHCRKPLMSRRPRRLCYGCYRNPVVREHYPPKESKFLRCGVGITGASRPEPTCSTSALPGTPEKLEVLVARASREEGLWHPEDSAREA